jgi:prephenate dehydrogenase
MGPQEHDRILSFVSHLPHVAAFSLISTVPSEFIKYAAGGLKGTTRIAASEINIWTDIFLSNRSHMLKAIGMYERSIASLKDAIARDDRTALERMLAKARNKKEALERLNSASTGD